MHVNYYLHDWIYIMYVILVIFYDKVSLIIKVKWKYFAWYTKFSRNNAIYSGCLFILLVCNIKIFTNSKRLKLVLHKPCIYWLV